MIGSTTAVRSRRLELLATPGAPRSDEADDLAVVLDTAWSPSPADGPGPRSIRPYVAAVVERHDLFAEALALVDGWARDASATDLLTLEGVDYWQRLRESMWHWMHERLLWRLTLAAIEEGVPFDVVRVPASEVALADVLRAMGREVELSEADEPIDGADGAAPPHPGPKPSVESATATTRARGLGRLVPPALRRIVRRGRRRLLPTQEQRSTSERRRRQELLESRFERLSGLPRPRAVILTQPSSYQQIGGATDGRRQDPDLGSVIPALLDSGIEPIVVGLGANKASEEDWEVIEGDDRMVPSFAVKARWGRGEDDARSEAATAAVLARSAAASNVPLVIDGTDLGPSFVEELRGLAGQIVRRQSNELARAERLLADLAPGALVTTHEHHRTAWILAANRAGIPTFALQHGVLYPAHPGYPDRRAPGVILPSLTFVFGEAERRVLLDTAYEPDEVEISGSPRLDHDATVTTTADSAAARRDVRRELGVADEDLLLVVSTVPAPFIRRFHVVHMLETVLGGPLPGVHVVFKQHPGERDSWPYRDFLHGLARAGAYEGPPISVVRDIDLYRLLRAADAHLGQQSTVLTDAVLAGTCNLIAIVEPGGDLLGYVAAGVAHPVRSVADVRAALTDLRPPSETARAAFMAEHARPGGASARIAATVAAAARAASNHATA